MAKLKTKNYSKNRGVREKFKLRKKDGHSDGYSTIQNAGKRILEILPIW